MWLMNELKPDDKTISNFRTDNAKPLKKAFREFSMMCRELGLCGGEVEATDGTKFQADNSRKNNYNKTTVEKELSRIEKRISEYLAALEQVDKEEQGDREPSATALKAALEKLQERKEKYEGLKERVEKEGEVTTVDTDAR
jgi:acetate kinase